MPGADERTDEEVLNDEVLGSVDVDARYGFVAEVSEVARLVVEVARLVLEVALEVAVSRVEVVEEIIAGVVAVPPVGVDALDGSVTILNNQIFDSQEVDTGSWNGSLRRNSITFKRFYPM